MTKQSAVEWLVDQYENTIGKSITAVMQDEINQAKEMEKQNIIDLDRPKKVRINPKN